MLVLVVWFCTESDPHSNKMYGIESHDSSAERIFFFSKEQKHLSYFTFFAFHIEVTQQECLVIKVFLLELEGNCDLIYSSYTISQPRIKSDFDLKASQSSTWSFGYSLLPPENHTYTSPRIRAYLKHFSKLIFLKHRFGCSANANIKEKYR